jgi:hypothetical protein
MENMDCGTKLANDKEPKSSCGGVSTFTRRASMILRVEDS